MAVDPHWANVVLLLRMDGANNSTVWTDESPSPKTITASGTPKVSTARSKFGGASTVFNNTDGLSAGSSSDFTFGTGDFTLEAWTYFTVSTLSTIVSLWSNWTWYKNGSNQLALYDHNVAFDILVAPISLNEWHHCALSRVAGVLYMHIDGALVATLAYTTNITSSNFLVGVNAPADALMNGYLDEVRATKGVGRYTASFPHPEAPFPTGSEPAREALVFDDQFDKVSLLLRGDGQNNTTVIRDSSPSRKAPAQVYGDAKIKLGQSRFGPTSICFDGANDAILLPYSSDLQLSGDFTIEGWLYPTSYGGFILNCGGGSGIAWSSYEILFSSTHLFFAASSANAGYDIGSEGGGNGDMGAVSLNQWMHFAVTCQGNVYRGFLNGVLGFTQTVAAHPFDTTSRGLVIGGTFSTAWGSTPNNSMQGYLDDLRITKGHARYTAGFTPPAAPAPRLFAVLSGNTKDSADANAALLVRAYRELTGELVDQVLSDAVTGNYVLGAQYADAHTLVYYPAAGEADPLQAKVYNGLVPIP